MKRIRTLKAWIQILIEQNSASIGTVIPSNHRMVWDAGGFPSGIYFVRLQTGSEEETIKLVLSR